MNCDVDLTRSPKWAPGDTRNIEHREILGTWRLGPVPDDTVFGTRKPSRDMFSIERDSDYWLLYLDIYQQLDCTMLYNDVKLLLRSEWIKSRDFGGSRQSVPNSMHLDRTPFVNQKMFKYWQRAHAVIRSNYVQFQTSSDLNRLLHMCLFSKIDARTDRL